jgi:hypothetical protein
MPAVATMPAMHEEVHANTKQQREPDQQSTAQNVHTVLVTQQKSAKDERKDQVDARA